MTPPSWIHKLRRLLLTGFFIIAPVSLTFILLVWFVATVDRALSPFAGLLGRPVPGLGLITALLLMLAAGVLGSNIFGRHLIEFVEEWLLRIPVLNWIYRTIKQVSGVFSPESRAPGRKFVLVEYPRPGVYSLGFVTNQVALEQDGDSRELLSVYVPTNHMYVGDTILVPKAQVVNVDLTQQQGLQAVISAGASLPARLLAQGPPS